MPTRRRILGAGAATFALAGIAAAPLSSRAQDATPPAGTDDDSDDEMEDSATSIVGTPILRPAIDIIRAQEIALEGNTGAAVNRVELEGDDGVLVYAVALDNGMEVDVDATTGAVIKSEQDDDSDEDDDEEEEDGEEEDDEGEDDDDA